MKAARLGLGVLAMAFVAAHAAEDEPLLSLKEGSWVCDTQESYEQAIVAEQQKIKKLKELRSDLEAHCIYMDDDNLEGMMAPWVTVLEQNGDKDKVSFAIEFERRISTINQQISQIKYTGWTSAANVKPRW